MTRCRLCYGLSMQNFVGRIQQLMLRQWQGKLPALVTILGILVGLRLLIGLIPFVDNQPLMWCIAALSMLILVWQTVGTWRCIERCLKAGEMAVYWFGCAAIVISIVLAALHTADLLVGPPPKITEESLRTKPLPRLSEDGSTVYLDGGFDFDMNTDLLTLVAKHDSIKTVELNSDGGLIYAARAIAFSIEKNQLNTHVEGQCNSACTVAFMAGNERTLGKSGKIGFHQYAFQKRHPLQSKETEDEQATDQEFFQRRGVTKGFLQKVYQSDHQNIWQPGRAELLAAGVITSAGDQ